VVTTGNETPFFGGEMNRIMSTRHLLALVLVLSSSASAAFAQTLQGGIQEKSVLTPTNQSGSYPSYPAPQMIQQQPTQATHAPPMHGNAFKDAPQEPPHRAPIQAGITKVALPVGFMGSWQVRGQRTSVQAQSPDFQQQAEAAFQMGTSNVWNISGNPQTGYKLTSDSGIDTQFWVDKLEGGAAFIRYQHPVKNTMAQEAVVMTLGNGGTTFEGLERISIVKQGAPPRVKVQYQLAGQRR
jgi:hypothetical protein